MKCRIIPLEKNSEISYKVKCVSVENERVFGEFFITNQTQDSVNCKNYYPAVWRKRKFNLVRKTLQSPDFMKMNSKPLIRRRSTISHISGPPQKNLQRSRSVGDDILKNINMDNLKEKEIQNQRTCPEPVTSIESKNQEKDVSTLVDQLLSDIYGISSSDRGKSESDSSLSSKSQPRHSHLQKARLMFKTKKELHVLLTTLKDHVSYEGGLLIRQLRRRDYLLAKRDKQYNVISAHLYRYSNTTNEETRMKFSLTPQPGESGFTQWLDAMKMVAGLPGGIPSEFRRRLWITLAERHLDHRRVDWKQAEKICFNEWSNPDDEELGTQIVKDLHRTGCSLFCGAAGRDNQAVLRRVLLGFARWNKSVGYCQGLNVLAALILQVVDRAESSAVKVMIYLIEGVLPEGYFADNLRGLSVDMAVFRDLLRMRLPRLSKHLEALQTDAKDKATGSSYEPPLTNVFTMQWFLTLFCHCLPQEAVLRVWDLIFLEGDEVLLRTALAIWEGLSDRIMTVKSADEFYSIMGVLTREMLEFTDTNNLIKTIVSMGPLYGVTSLREKHRYNITPWARRLSDDEDDSETEEEERLAVAAAAAIFSIPQRKKERVSVAGALQTLSSDREKLALDISTLKQQYAKLRERQRQAHIILSAACARQSLVPPPTSAMNHLLAGKNALVSGRNRQIGSSALVSTSKVKSSPRLSPRSQHRKDRQAITLHWKDMKNRQSSKEILDVDEGGRPDTLVHSPESMSVTMTSPKRSSADSDSDSTSTELCDEPDRLSDVDSEEPTSTSDCYVMATDDEKSPRIGSSPIAGQTPARFQPEVRNEFASVRVVCALPDSLGLIDEPTNLEETSISEITDQIRRLSAGDNDLVVTTVPSDCEIEKKSAEVLVAIEFEKNSFDSLNSYHFLRKNSRVGESELNELVTVDDKYENEFKEISESKMTLEFDIQKYDKIDRIESRVIPDVDYDYKSFDSSIGRTNSDSIGESNFLRKVSEKTYSKNYVVGHLPISPSTDDQKVYKFYETRKLDRNLDQSESNGWSSNLEYIYQKNTVESKRSPKTPESYSSGETMGPDSKPSSLTISPKTPLRSESRGMTLDKSTSSSVSSESKTLTLQSVEADLMVVKAKLEPNISSFDKSCSSTPISYDSLKVKSDCSPKLVVSSSSESYSPSKFKSSERSFSSDLQSPISANSIKFSSNIKDNGNLSDTPPIELISITSPFYPIAHPNKNTPSPYDAVSKQKIESVLPNLNFSIPQIKSDYLLSTDFSNDTNKSTEIYSSEFKTYQFDQKYNLDYDQKYNFEPDLNLTVGESAFRSYQKSRFDEDLLKENDSLPPLPRETPINRLSNLSQDFGTKRKENTLSDRSDYVKPFERSCSSLDKKFPELTSSSSNDELASSVRKRSSDILEDLKHLESNIDGSSDTNMLTKTTGYIWEDVQNLKARRQDTFSDSASGFSKSRLNALDISVPEENRKTYIVEPKIHIDENSDSILKKVAQKSINKEDDDRESKLGVWTKVKPRKIGDNGRRSSSDRALKIIQENSAILQKILTCQAKKRLPDLEEISKEITISPINEEISKIFSPILEKMGLNEHEINEELAKINFKDLGHMASTTSEFDAKINDELCKLSLIGDDDDVDPAVLDEIISQDYLDTRDAFIDRQINEELSKLLSNYDGEFAASLGGFKRDQLTKNNLDLYNYKKTDSRESKNGLSTQEEHLSSEKYTSYVDPIQFNSMSHSLSPLSQSLSPLSQSLSHKNQSQNPMNQVLNSTSQTLNSIGQSFNLIGQTNPKNQALNSMSHSFRSKGQTLNSLNQSLILKSHPINSISSSLNSSYQPLNPMSQTIHSVNQSLSPVNHSLNSMINNSNQTYSTIKYTHSNFTPKSDIDIYRELEKLDQISSVQVLPSASQEISETTIPALSYVPQTTAYSEMGISSFDYPIQAEKPFDLSPLNSPYDNYKPYDLKQNLSPRISPRKSPNSSYSVQRYEKTYSDSSFEFSNQTNFDFEMNHKKVLSKETLEFRVRYEEEQPQLNKELDLGLSPFQTTVHDINQGASYYSDKPMTPTSSIQHLKYTTNEEKFVGSSITNENLFLGSNNRNGERFLGSSEERFSELSVASNEKSLGLSSKNGERFLEAYGTEDERFSGTIDKNEKIFISTKCASEERFLGSSETNEESFLGPCATNEEKLLRSSALSPLEYKYERSDAYLQRKHSPKNYGSSKLEFDRSPYKLMGMDSGAEVDSYLMSVQLKEQLVSPCNQFNREYVQSSNLFLAKQVPSLEEASKRPVSHPEFPDKLNVTSLNSLPLIESVNHRKSSLSLGNIDYSNRPAGMGFDACQSPKSNFSPFPVRNVVRKPKELGLKLGLYSPTSLGPDQGRKS